MRRSPDSETLVFTGNGRQSLAAALATVVPTGGRCGVEALTYPFVKGIAVRLGISLVPLAMDEDGVRPDVVTESDQREKYQRNAPSVQAGLYVVAMFQIGHANPAAAVPAAGELFAAIVLGVVVADLVTWLAGAEHDLGIRFGEAPLWPVRGDWLSQSLMLAVTVLLTILGAHMLGLPPEKAAVSVMLKERILVTSVGEQLN